MSPTPLTTDDCSRFADRLHDRYIDAFTADQVAAAADTLLDRYGDMVADDALRATEVTLAPYNDDAVEIDIDVPNEIAEWYDVVSPIYADPAGDHCVRWGNQDVDVPPEGRAVNGRDEDVYGIR